jgi:hypothetical protein
MYQYLYAIADRLPAAWRPPAASVGGPVELRRLGDLVVLVSRLDRLPEANARTLALHHDVVATTLEASGTVPFRFGMVVDAQDLDAWLAAHAPLVNTTLAQLRGSVEMNVKLLRLHCGHSIDRTCRECADGAPGVVQLRELGERLVTQAGIERWRYRSPGRREQRRGIGRVPGRPRRGRRISHAHRAGRIARDRDRRRADRPVATVLVRSKLRPFSAGAASRARSSGQPGLIRPFPDAPRSLLAPAEGLD